MEEMKVLAMLVLAFEGFLMERILRMCLVEIAEQLKRIADALEARNKEK